MVSVMARRDPPDRALRKWRKMHNLTQRAAAEAIGVNELTWLRWEKARGTPSVAQLQVLEGRWPGLAELLGIVPRASGGAS